MEQKAWVISVNMGYGHQRTAFPLRHLAIDRKIINANDYAGIPEKDRKIWEFTRKFYEFISNFKKFPLVGGLAFSIFDTFQKILSFYPKRDLSEPSSQLKQTFFLIKKGWGRDLIEKLKARNEELAPYRNEVSGAGLKVNLPIVTTFFVPAFMAEYFSYQGEIFCVVCDADISRIWAPPLPKASRIKYFAPTERVVERLKLYGIKESNIFLTGYPLPTELLGSQNLEILKEDLKYRLLNLDPQRKYFEKYEVLIEENLGSLPVKSDHPLTIMFSVGGASAQKEIGVKILKCLRLGLQQGKIKVILSAGIKKGVKEYFENNIEKVSLKGNKNVEIIFEKDIEDYFQKFNTALRKTDILWTKPSELSFYSALGIPIIIAPAIGSQEEFNKRWLLKSGLGIEQEDPSNAKEWLADWLNQGYLAEAAMQGFIEGEKLGTFKISRMVANY